MDKIKKQKYKKWYNELKIKKGEIKMGVYKEMIYEEGYKEGINVGKEEGISLGKKEGLLLGKKETVIQSLSLGLDIETISKITGLSINEINKIKE